MVDFTRYRMQVFYTLLKDTVIWTQCTIIILYNKLNYVRQHYLLYEYIRLHVSTHQSVIFRPT